MPHNWSQMKLGFSTSATTLRPPAGAVWVVHGITEIGDGGTLVLTDGTTTENWHNTDSRDRLALSNEWYLTAPALTATRGWILAVET